MRAARASAAGTGMSDLTAGWRRARVGVGVGVGVRAWAMVVLAAGTVGVSACRGQDEGRNPESTVRAVIQSVRTGDRAVVYQQLGPATQARIQEALASGRRNGVSPLLRAEDLVTVGWVPPAWEPSSVREIRRDGDQADVEVSSVAGDHEIVHLVRQDKHWRLELPLR